MGARLTPETAASGGRDAIAPFASVLCCISASRSDPEAVAQAAVLAEPGGDLEIVCNSYETGVGATAQATVTHGRAEEALRRARRLAADVGMSASTRLTGRPEPWRAMLEEAPGHDLLVVGSRSSSRAGGMFIGSMATEVVHRAPAPVLVARKAPGADTPFPERILVACDDSPDSRRAVELALRICRVHDAEVLLLTVDGKAGEESRRAARGHSFHAAGVEPATRDVAGDPRTAIVDAAGDWGASLVIVGSGGKLGVRAIGSVSEHVAHHAPCSVLVARGAGA
jgi:nucleotide-binding universal stress UspA family protein